METFQCPYLGGAVELTDERERHIRADHPELPPDAANYIAGALASPDLVMRKFRDDGTVHFYRWYYDRNKYMVVVVVVNAVPRVWIVTAYFSNRVRRGEILWQRS